MSLIDDQAAELEAAIQNAKARLAYGKHFPARQLAKQIQCLRKMLVTEYGTLERAVDALSDSDEQNKGNVMLAHLFGTSLLKAALINPKAIRFIAEAFGKLEDRRAIGGRRAMAIITAYEECDLFPPTLGELRHKFIARFGEDHWRSDFSVRDTLRSLDLPLRKSRVGRPPGAKSVLKAWAVPQGRTSSKRRKISNPKRPKR